MTPPLPWILETLPAAQVSRVEWFKERGYSVNHLEKQYTGVAVIMIKPLQGWERDLAKQMVFHNGDFLTLFFELKNTPPWFPLMWAPNSVY